MRQELTAESDEVIETTRFLVNQFIHYNPEEIRRDIEDTFNEAATRLADALMHALEDTDDQFVQAQITRLFSWFVLCDKFLQSEERAELALHYYKLAANGLRELKRLRRLDAEGDKGSPPLPPAPEPPDSLRLVNEEVNTAHNLWNMDEISNAEFASRLDYLEDRARKLIPPQTSPIGNSVMTRIQTHRAQLAAWLAEPLHRDGQNSAPEQGPAPDEAFYREVQADMILADAELEMQRITYNAWRDRIGTLIIAVHQQPESELQVQALSDLLKRYQSQYANAYLLVHGAGARLNQLNATIRLAL